MLSASRIGVRDASSKRRGEGLFVQPLAGPQGAGDDILLEAGPVARRRVAREAPVTKSVGGHL